MGVPKTMTPPRFDSDQEERDFWARHRVEEFAGKLEDLDVAPAREKTRVARRRQARPSA